VEETTRDDDACIFSVDASDGFVVVEMRSDDVDAWLAHHVDACSIPEAGTCLRCRMNEISVVLIKLDADLVWLVAEFSLKAHLEGSLS